MDLIDELGPARLKTVLHHLLLPEVIGVIIRLDHFLKIHILNLVPYRMNPFFMNDKFLQSLVRVIDFARVSRFHTQVSC